MNNELLDGMMNDDEEAWDTYFKGEEILTTRQYAKLVEKRRIELEELERNNK